MDVKCKDIHYSIGEKKRLKVGNSRPYWDQMGVANQPCSKPFTAS